jgi:hypothetical protein
MMYLGLKPSQLLSVAVVVGAVLVAFVGVVVFVFGVDLGRNYFSIISHIRPPERADETRL